MSYRIFISIEAQRLDILSDSLVVQSYPISSARNGIGSEEGSYCTPIGSFIVEEKHGFKAPLYTIFKSRQPAGCWNGELNLGDLVLSRILWLHGTEDHNRNTKQRYIYIHGTNHEDLIGSPHSCGCIRMRNEDVVELYDLIEINTSVTIA